LILTAVCFDFSEHRFSLGLILRTAKLDRLPFPKVCNIEHFGEVGMPINRLLAQNSFKPEEIRRLNEAYEIALRTLHLVDRNDPVTEIVAKKVIEIGQTGISDPAQISQLAVKDLGLS
jgi:hypothetical protein